MKLSGICSYLQLGKLSSTQHFHPAGQQGAAVPRRLSCTFLLPRAQSPASARNDIFLLRWLFVIPLCMAGLRGQPRLTSLAVLPAREHFGSSCSLPHCWPWVSAHNHLTCRESTLWEREGSPRVFSEKTPCNLQLQRSHLRVHIVIEPGYYRIH